MREFIDFCPILSLSKIFKYLLVFELCKLDPQHNVWGKNIISNLLIFCLYLQRQQTHEKIPETLENEHTGNAVQQVRSCSSQYIRRVGTDRHCKYRNRLYWPGLVTPVLLNRPLENVIELKQGERGRERERGYNLSLIYIGSFLLQNSIENQVPPETNVKVAPVVSQDHYCLEAM